MPDSVAFAIIDRWNKLKEVSGILCGRGLSQRMKSIIYNLYLTSAMCNEAESRAVGVEEIKSWKQLKLECSIRVVEKL